VSRDEDFPRFEENHEIPPFAAFACASAKAQTTAPSATGEDAGPAERPAAARLDEVKCQAIWQTAQREGDVLLADKAKPYIANFEMVDTNKDGKISEAEFIEGCSGGWVLAPEESEKMQGEQPNSN
jgi:hypothetical protein